METRPDHARGTRGQHGGHARAVRRDLSWRTATACLQCDGTRQQCGSFGEDSSWTSAILRKILPCPWADREAVLRRDAEVRTIREEMQRARKQHPAA